MFLINHQHNCITSGFRASCWETLLQNKHGVLCTQWWQYWPKLQYEHRDIPSRGKDRAPTKPTIHPTPTKPGSTGRHMVGAPTALSLETPRCLSSQPPPARSSFEHPLCVVPDMVDPPCETLSLLHIASGALGPNIPCVYLPLWQLTPSHRHASTHWRFLN